MWFWEGVTNIILLEECLKIYRGVENVSEKGGLNKKGVKRKEREGANMTFKEIMNLGFLPEYFNNFVIHFFLYLVCSSLCRTSSLCSFNVQFIG